MNDLIHFDPINLVTMLFLSIAAIVTVRNTVSLHTKWIKKHDDECIEQRKINNEILTELKISNASLHEIAKSNVHRIDRIENVMDRKVAADFLAK